MCGTIGKNDKTIGKTSPGNSGIGVQNNTSKFVFAGLLSGDAPADYNVLLNAISITVTEIETPVYFIFFKKIPDSALLILETWVWKLGKGVYASVGAVSPITSMHLLETAYPQIGDLEPILTEGTLIDLGTITTDLITYINSQVLIDLSDAGTTYFLQYVLDGVTQIYEYTGVPLEYGTSTANTAVITDFDLIYDSNNSGTYAPTPSWQQTLDISEWGTKMKLYKNTTDFGTGFNDRVFDAKFQPDGKLIAGGDFTIFRENNSSKIVRINTDGTYDNTFSVGTGFNDLVRVIAIQTDGKVIAGGAFTNYNGTTANRIIRLNANGSIDGTFTTGTGFGNRVFGITIQPDGKILVLGEFTIYNGTAINRVVRLNTDGSIDGTFSVGTGFNNIPRKASIKADGKFVICGEFTNYNGTTVNRIARLNTDGSIDGTFATGTGFNDFTENTHILPDGKIYVFGGFTNYNGTAANRIVRLNVNGSIDGTFATGTGFNDRVRTIAVQADGQLLVSGEFTSYNGTTVNKAVRLNANGSINDAFIQGIGFNNRIWHVILKPSTLKMLFFGEFTSYNLFNAFRIIELNEFGDFRQKVLTFNDNENGIAEYSTDKTFDNLTEKELINKKLLVDYVDSLSTKFLLMNANQTTDLATSVNITDFTYQLEPNSVYILRGRLRVGCNATGGVKVTATTPLASEGLGTVFGRRNTDLTITIASPDPVTGVLPTTSLNNVASSFGQAIFDYMIFTGPAADTFNLVFASATAGQISTIYRLGSYLEVIKLQ